MVGGRGNNMKEYKINIANQLKHLEFTIGAVIVYLGYLYYLNISNQGWSSFIIAIAFVLFLPVVIIHVEYLILNFGMRISLDESEGLIKIDGKGKNKIISLRHVETIVYNRSRSLIYYSYKFFLTDEYHYCKIVLKSGESYIVTSLMAPNFKIQRFDNVEVRQRFMAFVFTDGLAAPLVSIDDVKNF